MGGAFTARIEAREEVDIREERGLFVLGGFVREFGHRCVHKAPRCAAEFSSK